MVGNVALDVVIGLVFIYLLYGLYATVIMEIISSLLGLRARNLAYTLARMLMDEKLIPNPFLRFGARLITTFSRVFGISANMKNPELYDKFFQQPSIKYRSSGGIGNTPSYLSAENFSQAIIDTLKTPDEDVSLLARIEQGLLNDLPLGSETQRQIFSLLDAANSDLVKFRILLEKWYDDTMERATGWFKQTTQLILGVIGLVLAVSFNVDTLAIIKKLSKDEDARNQLVTMATNFKQENSLLIAAIEKKDTDTTQSIKILNSRMDSLWAVKELLDQDIKNSKNILSADWSIPKVIKYDTSSKAKIHPDSIQIKYQTSKIGTVYLLIHKSVDPDLFKKVLSEDCKNGFLKVGTLSYKLKYVFNFDHIWGYLLTVLALSLGAPFWFDLLNKLIKLRTSSGVSKESGDKLVLSDSPISNRNILNRAG